MDRLDRLEKFLEQSARQLAKDRADTAKELADLRRQRDEELADLRRQHDEELAKIRNQHAKDKAKADQELAELRSKHNEELAEIRSQHAKDKAKADQELAELRSQYAKERTKYAEDKAKADQEHAELRSQYAKEHAELRRQHVETNRIVRRTDTIWGSVAEGLALGEVMDVLNKLPGIEVYDYAARVQNRKRGNFEIDAVAIGDHCVVLMEARAHLRKEAIGEFVKKFKEYLKHYHEHQNKRIYGLVAFLNIDSYAKQLAIKNGLLILRSDYLNKEIVNPPPEFTIRDFNPNTDKILRGRQQDR